VYTDRARSTSRFSAPHVRIADVAEQIPADATGRGLERLAGTWQGSNRFRMMPTDDFTESPATAFVTTAAGGHAVVVTYTWEHPQDGPQEGVLLVGSPDEDGPAVAAAWADSWHQQPSILTLPGIQADGRLEVTADYGGGWRWTIALEGTDPLLLTMHNVVPDDQATDDVEAGPYPVMLAELNRQT
jgi:hypothetical protein